MSSNTSDDMAGDPLATGCPTIDDALNGGFPRGQVSQVYGKGGSGKTNLVTATAVHTIAKGGTVYFYVTEDSPVNRLETLAAAHPETEPPTVLENVFLNTLSDFGAQHGALTHAAHTDASEGDLIIVDSLSGFYRLERGQRTEDEHQSLEQQMTEQLIHLLTVARRNNLAVLLTNQVYYHPDLGQIRPLGGTALQYWCQVVGRLEDFSNNRHALTIEKHPHSTVEHGETAIFTIVEDGLVVPS